MIVVTPKQMKFLEAESDRNGNTYEMLMEKAGRGLAEKIQEILKSVENEIKLDVFFLCGNGNNAGDCFVAQRYLDESGIKSTVAMLCGEPKTDLAKLNFSRMQAQKVFTGKQEIINQLSSGNLKLIVDGVFGTGFHGELPGDVKEIFSAASERGIVIAVDVPSGGNCSSGYVSDGTMNAVYTYTFAFEKFGMAQYPLKSFCGEIQVIDIGIPEKFTYDFEHKIIKTTKEFAEKVIPKKRPDSHKGNYGRLLIVCGSEKMPGACIMAAEAAAKSGVGLLKIASVKSVLTSVTNRLPESMLEPMGADENGFISENNFDKIMSAAEKADAVLIGCGLGVTDGTKKLVKELIKNINCPVILDADGINCIADSIDIIKQKKSSIILTPHPAEMGRLCKKSTAEVQSDRLGTAVSFSEKYDATVVLKGAGTVIAENGNVYVNLTGNPGMGKGGSGDVLSGIISSLAAQGISTLNASVLGAYVHGIAGDIAAEKKSMQSMTATDIINELPEAFKQLTE
ncbi:NAD(P)H-hydrate dehydratase [Porcipelethomonas sp.]|uniref:NAD(P)H-hydrate dehydratase n=1 Tax=Porcipelethomonas sp. TaxID=2981675 RepID=UPI003EFA8B54